MRRLATLAQRILWRRLIVGYAEGVRFNSLGSRACERTLGYETKLIPDTPKVLNNHASIV